MKHTIFTPVYNRANEMYELYESIKNTRYNQDAGECTLEWLIIDDGSQDDLKSVLEKIKDDAKINATFLKINCIHKENGGIHIAQNVAVNNAKGEYITRIDSDDRLLPDAFEKKDRLLDSIPEDIRDKFVGVVGLCLNKKDLSVRGDSFPEDIMDTTGVELLRKYNLKGDRNFCMRTDIMRKFPIPEYNDTKYVPESIIWRRIDKEYITRFANEPMSVCAEPNPSSMSGFLNNKYSPSACLTNFYGAIYAVNEQKGQLSAKRYYAQYYKALLNARLSGKRSLSDVLSMTQGVTKKALMVLLAVPVYLIAYIKYKK